jgi:hypothetical protein
MEAFAARARRELRAAWVQSVRITSPVWNEEPGLAR